jgi:hypothetical protein
MTEELRAAVGVAIANSQPPPMNEIETCHRIIYPLLLAAGYGYLEIRAQDLDAAKQKPDYTILPDSPDHSWFLEAKAWNVTLDDNHAVQAINYANTQGKRWVVLSNGREWRLYDNQTFGTAEVKLACVAHLQVDSFASFLEALSKGSILKGKLEDFVRNERLYSCLGAQIGRTDSEVVKAITKVLRASPGLATVSASDVVGFFRDYASGAPSTVLDEPIAIQSPIQPKGETAKKPVPGVVKQPESTPPGGYPLGTISSQTITGRKLSSLVLPDGKAIQVPRWNQLTVQVLLFALKAGATLDVPYFMSQRSKSPLVAKQGSAESKTMREAMPLPAPYSDWLVEGHFSANDHQSAASRVLQAAGIEPTSFRLILADA